MDKVKSFLEKYVQFVALGLAVLWCVWMAYTHVLTSPIKAEVNGETHSAGDVDEYIQTNKADAVERATKDKVPKTLEMIAKTTPKDPGTEFATAFNIPNRIVPNPLIPKLIPDTQTAINAPTTPGMTPGGVQKIVPIAELPTVPAATEVGLGNGRSAVDKTQADNPNAIAAAGGMPGGMPSVGDAGVGEFAPPRPPVRPTAPVAAVPGAPGAAAVPVVAGQDVDWVSVKYTINPAEIAAAFDKVKLAPDFYKLTFLEVVLERQEKLADGSWGNDQRIVPLTNVAAAPPAYPGDGVISRAKQAEAALYIDWATRAVADILQPSFYLIVRGDRWALAGETVVNPNAIVFNPADPTTWSTKDISKLPPDQKKAVLDYNREQQAKKEQEAREKRKTATPKTPAPTGRPGRGGGPGGGEPGAFNQFPGNEPAVTPEPFQARSGGRAGAPAGGRRGAPPAQPVMPDDIAAINNPNVRGTADLPGAGPSGVAPVAPIDRHTAFPLPVADVDPRTLLTPITGWAHDVTVQPGVTYRYRITYKIKNPVWGTKNAIKDETKAAQLAITSPASEWTAVITIPTRVSFWLTQNVGKDAPNARFEVFKWQDGVLNNKTYTLAPGDIIGGSENGVDFGTGWTVVDIRQHPSRPNDSLVMLMSPSGELILRDPRADSSSSDYQTMRGQVGQPAAAAGTPGAPGAVATYPPARPAVAGRGGEVNASP